MNQSRSNKNACLGLKRLFFFKSLEIMYLQLSLLLFETTSAAQANSAFFFTLETLGQLRRKISWSKIHAVKSLFPPIKQNLFSFYRNHQHRPTLKAGPNFRTSTSWAVLEMKNSETSLKSLSYKATRSCRTNKAMLHFFFVSTGDAVWEPNRIITSQLFQSFGPVYCITFFVFYDLFKF